VGLIRHGNRLNASGRDRAPRPSRQLHREGASALDLLAGQLQNRESRSAVSRRCAFDRDDGADRLAPQGRRQRSRLGR